MNDSECELNQYVDLFRSSAERVRRIIFIIMIFSLIVFVAQWNTNPSSWAQKHFNTLQHIEARVKYDPELEANAEVRNATGNTFQTRDDLKTAVEEIIRNRMRRVICVEIPGLGVLFNVNDLGIFSGISYAALPAPVLPQPRTRQSISRAVQGSSPT